MPRNEKPQASDGLSLPTLAEIYREYHAFVWRNLRRLGVPDCDIDDVVHEVFLVVHRRLGGFEGRSKLSTWIFSIALWVVRGLRRDREREKVCSERLMNLHRLHIVPSAEGQEASLTLRNLLSRIDARKRLVFILVELEGMTAQETAEALQIKASTVQSRLHAARQELLTLISRSAKGST